MTLISARRETVSTLTRVEAQECTFPTPRTYDKVFTNVFAMGATRKDGRSLPEKTAKQYEWHHRRLYLCWILRLLFGQLTNVLHVLRMWGGKRAGRNDLRMCFHFLPGEKMTGTRWAEMDVAMPMRHRSVQRLPPSLSASTIDHLLLVLASSLWFAMELTTGVSRRNTYFGASWNYKWRLWISVNVVLQLWFKDGLRHSPKHCHTL